MDDPCSRLENARGWTAFPEKRRFPNFSHSLAGGVGRATQSMAAAMSENAKIVTVDLKRKSGVLVGTVTEVDRTTGVTETVPLEQARESVLGKRVNIARAE